MIINALPLIEPIQTIVCLVCNEKAERVGTQDECDNYTCASQHLTRIRIGAPRIEWTERESG